MHDPAAVLARIRSVMKVLQFFPPPDPEMIARVEQELGVSFPDWLRRVYEACNGFTGPTNVGYLWRLDGREGVLEFTQFLRASEWSPAWLERAIVFGDNGSGGSITTHWAALDSNLIEWCYGDGEQFTSLKPDLYALWKREQERWNTFPEYRI